MANTSEFCGWCGESMRLDHSGCIAPLDGMAEILDFGAIEGEVIAEEAHAAAARTRDAADRIRMRQASLS